MLNFTSSHDVYITYPVFGVQEYNLFLHPDIIAFTTVNIYGD